MAEITQITSSRFRLQQLQQLQHGGKRGNNIVYSITPAYNSSSGAPPPPTHGCFSSFEPRSGPTQHTDQRLVHTIHGSCSCLPVSAETNSSNPYPLHLSPLMSPFYRSTNQSVPHAKGYRMYDTPPTQEACLAATHTHTHTPTHT